MNNRKFRKFESLENRLCLSVSVSVDDGDLVVSGDADGAVEIVAVSAVAYRVTDNGVLIADESTLQGATDDIRINLEENVAGTNDTVTVDLGGQTVDRVYAELGDGDNSFELTNGTASVLNYHGGEGIDSVALSATIESRALVSLGDGANDLTVSGAVGQLTVHGGDDADLVAITDTADVSKGVLAHLGDGDNSLSIAGTVEGQLLVSARDGADSVTVAEGATIGRNVRLALGDGDNSATIAGNMDGNLAYDGGDGNDSVTLTETAILAKNFLARLGEGENIVTHNGNVAGNFRVVSANEDDTVDISDTAVVGGKTDLGLGDQVEGEHGGGCHGGEHTLGRMVENSLETLSLNGRNLGFYYRGFRR